MKNILKKFMEINENDYFIPDLLIINVKELFIISIEKNNN